MKKSTKKILALIMAVALTASSSAFAGISVYADNEATNAVVEITDDATTLNAVQQEAYEKITAACKEFVNSDVSLSTLVFAKIELSTGGTKAELEAVVEQIQDSGKYAVLDRVAFNTADAESKHNVIVLFTKAEYKTPAGREALKSTVEITSQPKDQTVAVGEKATFTVAASGEGLTYQWQISTNSGSTWKSFANTTDTFSITAKAAYNGYMYRCIVTDANGNSVTSDAAKLIVRNDTCTITSQPTDQTVAVGEKAKFVVTATGEGTISYQWQISTDGGTTWKSFANTTDTFSITAKAAYNGYMYRCIVTDANGNSVTSDAAKLIVRNDTCTITSQPTDQTVAVGEKAKFVVTATGEGTISYQWQISTDGGTTWKSFANTTDTFSI
ncbi:MAG: hypothetical protein ACI4JK_02275, partial [Oscillospiraceae bacterium]